MTFIGLDLGTSSLKAILIDEDQRMLAEHSVPLTVQRPHDGWAEQDPQSWLDATVVAIKALGETCNLNDVTSMGISGHMHGAVLLDRIAHVLRPCMLWNDTRAAKEAAEMDSDPQFRKITGNIMFPGFTAPKVEWIRRYEPEVFANLGTVMLPKDFLRASMSGEKISDMSDASGTGWFDPSTRDWSDTLLSACGLTRDHMPRLAEGPDATARVKGWIGSNAGLPQIKIAGGAGDNAAAAIGAGVVRDGDAFLSLGTSGVLFAANDSYRPDSATAVHTFCHALPDTWHQMGVILAATDALEWLSRLTGQSAAELTADLGDLRTPSKTMFLPYLGGERTPHNDAKMRGQFLHLDHATDAKAAARAVLEGVTFAFADCQQALAATGTQIKSALALGGGSKSDYWLSLLATTLNIPLDIPQSGDFGAALGAARLGMMADGADASIITQPPIAKSVDPQPDLRDAFTAQHARYQHAYAVMKDL